MADNSQFKTPGEVLGSARKEAGFSLAELSTRTKIPQDMLQAIERDEYHKISGDLYVKSFMGSFAQEVGVEPEIVVNMYRDFSGEAPNGTAGPSANQWDEESVEVSSVGLPWLKLAAIAVAVFCLGGALYFFVLRGDGNQEVPLVDDTSRTETLPVETTPVPVQAVAVGLSAEPKADTLSIGWQNSPAVVEAVKAVKEETASPIVQDVPAFTSVEDSASRILATTGRGHLPPAFPGDGHVVFEGNRKWPVVLRLLCDKPVGLKIKRDAEEKFSSVVWLAEGTDIPSLPAKNVIAGQAYAVRQGMAVYWGAGDHFSLVLSGNEEFEMSINGTVRDLSRVKPGQEIILDAPARVTGQ